MKNKKQTPNQLNALGVQQCKNAKYKDAEKFFRKALGEENENTAFLSNLAYSLRKQDKFEEAESVLLEAVKIDPKNKALWSDLGLVQTFQCKYEEAIKSCLKALHLDPTNTLFSQNLVYLKSQQALEASSYLARNVALSAIVDCGEVVQSIISQKQSSQSSSLKL